MKYAFPAAVGSLTRGMVTGYAAAPLNSLIIGDGDDPPPVWPDAHGTARGYSLMPLYPSVPQAAKRDAKLYEVLALLDAVRAGRARERKLAADMLTEYLMKDYAA